MVILAGIRIQRCITITLVVSGGRTESLLLFQFKTLTYVNIRPRFGEMSRRTPDNPFATIYVFVRNRYSPEEILPDLANETTPFLAAWNIHADERRDARKVMTTMDHADIRGWVADTLSVRRGLPTF